MSFPKNWMIFPVIKNGKRPIIKDWYGTKVSKDVLDKHTGNFGLACGNVSSDIVVFDWDFKHGFGRKELGFKYIFEEYTKNFPNLWNTKICETPHGFHLYYRILKNQYKNTSKKNGGYLENGFIGKCKVKYNRWLSALDTRANGGYVVIPPSVINGFEYKWINDVEPLEITKKDYDAIMTFFKQEHEQQTTMRSGFVKIANGIIDVHKIKHETDLDEHVYWKEFYHEVYCCCGLLPEDLLDGLEKKQPAFNRQKTIEQINNIDNRNYILDSKRMTTEAYNQYFPEEVQEKKVDEFNELIKEFETEERMVLEGRGNIIENDKGLFLEKVYYKHTEILQILEGKLEMVKFSYEPLINNRLLFTGIHDNRSFRTLPLPDLLNRLTDHTYQGLVGKDIVKKFIHLKRKNLPEYKLAYILGFNSHWSLPYLEEETKTQILVCTDEQQLVYNNSKKIIIDYSEEQIEIIKTTMQNFLKLTKMNEIKLSLILGWSMAAPFRHTFIKMLNLFPILCAYGDRNTGKSSVLECFVVKFFGVHDSYFSAQLLKPSRLEDVLSTGSFPIFIQEVKYIPKETIGIIKEHATGSSNFLRKKNARENDVNAIKSAGLALDCNNFIENLTDPASNTKILMIPFDYNDVIEIDPSWAQVRNELFSYKLFSLYYNYTKEWTDKDIELRIDKYMAEVMNIIKEEKGVIEKDNPRIIQHYIIVSFGIDLFNEIFETNFKRDKILEYLTKSRTILTEPLLDDFISYCDEAIVFDSESKNPYYLSHKLEDINSSKRGNGYLFAASNKTDFNRMQQEKYDMKDLSDKLRDALPQEKKEWISYYRTGKIRGIFVSELFFKEQKELEVKK